MRLEELICLIAYSEFEFDSRFHHDHQIVVKPQSKTEVFIVRERSRTSAPPSEIFHSLPEAVIASGKNTAPGKNCLTRRAQTVEQTISIFFVKAIGKAFKRILADKLRELMIIYILYPFQYGFSSGRPTKNSLLKPQTDYSKSLNAGRCMLSTFLDIE